MAPKLPNLNDNNNGNRGPKSDIPKQALPPDNPTEPQHLLSEPGHHAREVSLWRQVALCAGLLASDGGLVFMQLMMLPTLQTLGVPVNSVTLPGCLSGIMCLVGLPVLGWLSDGGSHPHGRKRPAVMVSALVFIAGFSLVISGCGLHTWIGARGAGDLGKGESLKSSVLPPSSFRFPQNSTEVSFQDTTNETSALSLAGSSLDEVSSAATVVRDLYTSEPQHTSEDAFKGASPTEDRHSSPREMTSSSEYARNPTEEEEEKENSTSSIPAWMSDPLGLAIPFVGLLGILGFAFIDMGNDLNNSSQKSYVLASTPARQHVSLLVVGVQLSALGGCVAAALGVTDLADTLVQGTLLDTVPGKTLVQFCFFIALTFLCVLTTILSVPSSSPSHPAHDIDDVKPGDVTSKKHPSYGTVRDNTGTMITPSTSAAVLLESGAVSWADRSLQASSKHLDKHSHRFPRPDSMRFSRIDNSVSDYLTSSCESATSTDTAYLLNDNSVRRHGSWLSLRHSAAAGASDHETKKAKLFASNSIVYYAIESDGSESSDSDSGCERGESQMEEERSSSCSLWDRLKSRQTRRLALICISMFFMCGAWQSFNVCATDYLGKVIYGGDPDADTESQSYASYQKGMRMGCLGVLILNGVYVIVNFMQKRLLTSAGPKIECLVVCGLQVGSLIALLMTDNIVAYYVTSIVFGIFRSAMYTIPFMLANEICQEEAKSGGDGKANVGSTMALVTTMIPLSNLLVSSMTGPLIYSTQNPAAPLYYTIAATFVSAVVFIFT